ncbi:hypothetical protein ZOSMA_10G00180 [Zostera marina]|uniref:Trichome birefringence-like C-terminal domain-containing protein n=1 Tax=Zostera marina TaxID=29655 RepID=A0A0K9Q5L4_ZOSMR|nr:hypothetical protein ZOSMA_10G00180 [Zostera marina]
MAKPKQKGGKVKVQSAYERAIDTLLDFVCREMNSTKIQVFFRTYSPVHFRNGNWSNGGRCDISNEGNCPCTAASYFRMIPNIKKGYDYGIMIFILTFSLVAVSGIRDDRIIKQAKDRLLAIFPVWAGDELQASLESHFKSLASLFKVRTYIYMYICMYICIYIYI